MWVKVWMLIEDTAAFQVQLHNICQTKREENVEFVKLSYLKSLKMFPVKNIPVSSVNIVYGLTALLKGRTELWARLKTTKALLFNEERPAALAHFYDPFCSHTEALQNLTNSSHMIRQ